MAFLRSVGFCLALALLPQLGAAGTASAQTQSVTGSFADGTTQLGRIFRDAIPSACPGKAYPGIFNAGTTYNYEAYSFLNTGGDTCVEIAFNPDTAGSSPCSTNAHASAYLNAYDPGNQGANFLGDVGSSQTQSFFVEVPAGQTLIVVVSNTAAQATCDYAFDVIGMQVGGSATSSVDATKAVIRNFLNRRAHLITTSGPETQEFHRRFTGSLFGGEEDSAALEYLAGRDEPARRQQVKGPRNDLGAVASPLDGSQLAALDSGTPQGDARAVQEEPLSEAISLGGSYLEGSGHFTFGTSLSRLSRAQALAQSANGVQVAEGSGFLGGDLNVWTEGEVAFYRDELGNDTQEGTFALVYAGADYLVHPGVLVGALVQVDWMDEESDASGVSIGGTGWMAGPYVSLALTPNLFFDARAAWGRSSNEVSPFGSYEDEFDTVRSLYSAKLTGVWRDGAWLYAPEAEIVYFEETQEGYTDQLGQEITEQTVSLGRVIVGPEVIYQLDWETQGQLELSAGLKGIWDFDKDDEATVNGVSYGTSTLQGRVELGAGYTLPSNISTRFGLSYDGLGDSEFEAYRIELVVHVPF